MLVLLSQSASRDTVLESVANTLQESKQCCMALILDDDTLLQKSHGKYILVLRVFDTSHPDSAEPFGSLFLIFKKHTTSFRKVSLQDLKQSGDNIIATGYCLYSSTLWFALAQGFCLNLFSYDADIGEFILTNPK